MSKEESKNIITTIVDKDINPVFECSNEILSFIRSIKKDILSIIENKKTIDSSGKSQILNIERVLIGKEIVYKITAILSKEDKFKQKSDDMIFSKDTAMEALSNFGVGYFEIDTKGNILEFNKAIEQIAGYSQEELIGMNYQNLIEDTFDINRIKSIYRESTFLVASSEVEWMVKSKDGTKKIIKQLFAPQKNSEDKIIGYHGIVIDITNEKKKEEKLTVFKESIETSVDGVVFINSELQLIYTNDSFNKMFGYNKNELLKMYIHDFWYDKKEVQKILPILIKKGNWKGRIKTKKQDGTDFYVEVSASVVRNSSNDIMCIVGSFEDITENVLSEEALIKSEDKYRSLVNNLNVGIFRSIENPNDFFQHVNPAMIKILGYESINDFSKIKIIDIYNNPADRVQIINKLKQGKSIKGKEIEFKKKNGEIIIVSLTTTAILSEEGNIVQIDGIIEDITEKKGLEKNEKELQKKLETTNELLKLILNSSDSLIVTLDLTGNIKWANSKLLKKCNNIALEELIGKKISDPELPMNNDIKNTIDKLKTNFYEAIKNNENFIKEIVIENITYECTIIPTVESDAAIIFFKDITNRLKDNLRTIGKTIFKTNE